MNKIFWSEWFLGIIILLSSTNNPALLILALSNLGICLSINYVSSETRMEIEEILGEKK